VRRALNPLVMRRQRMQYKKTNEGQLKGCENDEGWSSPKRHVMRAHPRCPVTSLVTLDSQPLRKSHAPLFIVIVAAARARRAKLTRHTRFLARHENCTERVLRERCMWVGGWHLEKCVCVFLAGPRNLRAN
jgi:hypothetical protein